MMESDVQRLHQLLADAQILLRQNDVSLRCDTELFETVYVVAEGDDVLVSDRGETFLYIDRGTNATYGPWDEHIAVDACHSHDVQLAQIRDDDGSGYTIQRRVQPGEPVELAVKAVSGCIDEVFRRHVVIA